MENAVRKLIGSECRDRIGYNNEVRAILNVDDVILLRSHGTVMKAFSHCIFFLVAQLGKPRARKRLLAGVSLQ